MCVDCGCGLDPHKHDVKVEHSHDHHHNHSHNHDENHHHHHHHHDEIKDNPQIRVDIVQKILAKNDAEANHNRAHFDNNKVTCFNLMSSPGSGKTTTLENLVDELHYKFGVIDGDLETNRDADRLAKKGIWATQIQTGSACHLDATMVHKGLHGYPYEETEIAFIENVGNLVCPASYDVGAHYNIVLLSVPEGDDKVAKYPVMFRQADLVVITKADTLEYFDFDVDKVKKEARKLKPYVPVILLDNKSKKGFDELVEWIEKKHKEHLEGLE